jgi:hypothetical protein
MFVLDTDVVNPDNNEVIPQAEHLGLDYDWEAPDSVRHLTENVPLARPPNLGTFHLDPETELTDVVTQRFVIAKGLLVSERFCGVLDGFLVQRHERYATEVVLRGEARPYSWLHFTEELEDRIDYATSEFLVTPLHQGPPSAVQIGSRAELAETARRLVNTIAGGLKPRKVAFLPGTPAYDLLCLQWTTRTFYVSAPLAERLSGAGLTGFEVAPADAEFVFP